MGQKNQGDQHFPEYLENCAYPPPRESAPLHPACSGSKHPDLCGRCIRVSEVVRVVQAGCWCWCLYCRLVRTVKPKFHYTDLPVTSATSPRQTHDVPFSPNSITPTSTKLPRTGEVSGNRYSGIWFLMRRLHGWQMSVSESDIDQERELRELFRRTAGEDLEVDPYELRTILDSNFKHGSLEFIHSVSESR